MITVCISQSCPGDLWRAAGRGQLVSARLQAPPPRPHRETRCRCQLCLARRCWLATFPKHNIETITVVDLESVAFDVFELFCTQCNDKRRWLRSPAGSKRDVDLFWRNMRQHLRRGGWPRQCTLSHFSIKILMWLLAFSVTRWFTPYYARGTGSFNQPLSPVLLNYCNKK